MSDPATTPTTPTPKQQVSEVQSSPRSPSEEKLKSTAISYVDEDWVTHSLTYKEFFECLNIVTAKFASTPFQKTVERYRRPIVDGVSTDTAPNESVKLPPVVVLYGDLHQYTPVFMNAVNRSKATFYTINQEEQLREALKQLPANTIVAFITHKFRLYELTHLLKGIFGSNIVKSFFLLSDYYLVCLKLEEKEKKESKLAADQVEPANELTNLKFGYLINTSGTSSSLVVVNSSSPAHSTATTLIPSSKYVFVTSQAIGININDFKVRFRGSFELKSEALSSSTVVLLCSPFDFDPSICDTFLALFSYAHLVIVANSMRNSPTKLKAIINQFGVTYATLTPSLWRKLTARNTEKNTIDLLSSFEQINFGGEVSPSLKEVASLLKLKPDLQVYNLYGVTEVSSWASVFRYSDLYFKSFTARQINAKSIYTENQHFFMDFLPILGGQVFGTKVYLNADNELVIESKTRKCLIYTPSNSTQSAQWTFKSVYHTGDRGYGLTLKRERQKADNPTLPSTVQLVYFVGRLCRDDFVKLNGVKCNLRCVENFVLERFSSEGKYGPQFAVLYCVAVSSEWSSARIAIIDLSLVVDREKKTDISSVEMSQIILSEVRKVYNFAFRLHLHDESTVGAVLSNSGKFDAGRLHLLAQNKKTVLEEVSQAMKEELEELEEKDAKSIESTIYEIISSTVSDSSIMEQVKSEESKELRYLGAGSIQVLQIAVQIEQAFEGKFAQRGNADDDDDDEQKGEANVSEHFFEIVNGCTVKAIVSYVQSLFVKRCTEKQEVLPASDSSPNDISMIGGNMAAEICKVPTVSRFSHRVKVLKKKDIASESSADSDGNDESSSSSKGSSSDGVSSVTDSECMSFIAENDKSSENKSVEDESSEGESAEEDNASIEGAITEPYTINKAWSFFMEECVDSTPLIVLYKEVTYLIAASHSGLVVALDPFSSSSLESSDGSSSEQHPYKLLWRSKLSSRIETSPVANLDGSIVFICTYTGHMMALATSSGAVLWSYQTGDIFKCNPPTVSGSFVLAGSYDQRLYCWRADANGTLQWSVDLKAGALAASPVVFDEGAKKNLLVATLTGTVVALCLEDGHELWRSALSENGDNPIFATPLVYDDFAIVCLVKNVIFCICLSSGRILWGPASTSGLNSSDLYSPPVAVKLPSNRVAIIVPIHNGTVLALDAYNRGSLIWKAHLSKSSINCVPFLVGDGVIIIDTEGVFYLLNVLTGKAFSGKTLVQDTDSATASSKTKVLRQKCFKITNWQQKVFSSPIFYEGRLFFGARDSCLHCFHLNLNQ